MISRRPMAVWLLVIPLLGVLHGAEALSGAGATFPFPLYRKWFATYRQKPSEVSIQYRAVGSGAGVEALRAREVDFAASDYPLNGERLSAFGRGVRQIPSIVGGLVPVYHLEGVMEDLRFSPETLAGIYLGKIRRWNDPALKAVNPRVRLPARDIVVVHRSDASGSTYIWSNYLASVSESWKSTVGTGELIQWPAGVGAEQNEGVATAIAHTPDSIGYVEFIYALSHRLDYGAVRNRAGRFVQADLASLQAAVQAFESDAPRSLLLPITDAPGAASYPIASLTYLLVPEEWPLSSKRSAMLEFLSWMLSAGRKQAASLGYVALPPRVAERAVRVVEEMRSATAR